MLFVCHEKKIILARLFQNGFLPKKFIARFLWIFVFLCFSGNFSAVHSATINQVQSGIAISSGNGTISVSITAVDPGRSFLMFQTRSSSNRPPGSTVRGRINSAGTAVEFVRVTNETSTINIQWYVMEFSSGVSVQRGEVNQTSSTLNVPITAVSSTSQAFVLYSKTPRNTDSIWSSDDPSTGRLTSNTNVQFRASNGNSSHIIDWQVVEFTNAADINVQTGSSAMSSGTGSINITLPTAVNTASSFALVGFLSPDSGPDVDERMIRAQLIDSTTLRIDRDSVGDRIDEIIWQVVELNDGSSVQHGSELLNSGDAQNTIAISTIDVNRSVAFASVQAYSGQNMGMNNYNGDDITGVSSVTLELSSTSINMRRNFTGQRADIGWFVVEFNGTPPVTLPAAVGEWRMDETSWTGTAGEVVDSTGNGLDGVRMGSATTAPAQVCNGAALNGSTDFVEVADNALLDISDNLTVMTWIRPNSIPGSGLMSILSKDENYEFHINSSANINWWWQNSAGTTRQFNSSGVTLIPGTWYHIAIVYSNSGSQIIYIDGVNRGSTTYTENLINNNDPLQIGADQGFSGREFDGMIDEVRIYNAALSAAQVGIAMTETRPCPTDAFAYYAMDDVVWGSVVDSSGNGNHGVAVGTAVPANANPVVVGTPGTCGYGEFPSNTSSAVYDAVDTGVDINNDVGNAGTINFWYKSNVPWDGNNGDRQLMDASLASSGKYFYLSLQNNSRLSFGLEDSVDGDWRPEGGNNNFPANVWVHIAVTWDLPNDRLQIYINGNLDVSQTYPTNGVLGEMDTLYFGDNRSSYIVGSMTGNSANGSIDEARIYNIVRSQVEIQADMNATHPCNLTLDHFVISHNNTGINCLTEAITVTAKLSGGATYTGYTGNITLDTQSATGSWTLNTGTTLNFSDAVANDGLATYTFDVTDNGVAIFDLDYQSGTTSIDIDAYDGVIRDDDTEGNLVFSPNGFTVTASPLAVPFSGVVDNTIPAQTAASDFPLYLAAYGVTPTDPVCGIIEAYTGAKNLKFWSTYNNPGTGTLPVTINTVNAFTDETTADAGSTQPVTFNNGQAVVTVNYADVGQITLATKDDSVSVDLPTGIRGISDAFVVKPADFILSAIERSSDSFVNPGTATDENGAAFMAAGDTFSVTVTAVNALGNSTPNYGQESIPESVVLTPALVAAGAANNPAIAFTSGFDGFITGIDTGIDFHWDEVGIITLTPSVADGDYLGGGDVTGTASANVGRFYPDHFVTSTTDGSFANTCTSGTAFTYLGEGFDYLSNPTVTAMATSAVNTTTANYTGTWAKLTIGGISLSYPTADNSQLDENGVLAIGITTTAGTLARVDNNNGSLTFTLGGASADDFTYERNVGQVAPFTSDLTISLSAVSDGEASANDTPRNISPVGNLQRFGRAYAQDVHGTMSQVGDSLLMPITSWFFNVNSGWTLNADDSCSSYNYTKTDINITATAAPTSPVTLTNGAGNLTLTLTGAGNPGGSSILNTVWPDWLQYDYDTIDQLLDGNLYDDNPSATATFGIFRGDDRYLYWRESP